MPRNFFVTANDPTCQQRSLENQIQQSGRKLLGNVFWLYGLQGLNYVLPLVVLPYLVRVLGVERYGLISFAQALAQYFVIFTDYGFNLSATKRISKARDNAVEVSRLFWSVITIKVALMLVGMVVLGGVIAAVPRLRPDAVLYVIAYIAVVGSVLFPTWLFQGMEQMHYVSVVSGGAKLISALCLFVFVRGRYAYVEALAIQSCGMLMAGVAGFSMALTSFTITPRMPRLPDIRETLAEGWHLFVATAATTFYTNSNVFLVGILAGNAQAGYFSAAEKIIRSMQGLLTPITQAIYPHMNYLAANARERALVFVRKSLLWIGALSLPPSAALLVLADPVGRVVCGPSAEGCSAVLRWIAVLPFVIAVSNVLGIQTMIPFGLDRQLSRIYSLAGLASLALAVPLIRQYGATGAGASVLAIEVAVVCLMGYALKIHGVHFLRSAVAAPSVG